MDASDSGMDGAGARESVRSAPGGDDFEKGSTRRASKSSERDEISVYKGKGRVEAPAQLKGGLHEEDHSSGNGESLIRWLDENETREGGSSVGQSIRHTHETDALPERGRESSEWSGLKSSVQHPKQVHPPTLRKLEGTKTPPDETRSSEQGTNKTSGAGETSSAWAKKAEEVAQKSRAARTEALTSTQTSSNEIGRVEGSKAESSRSKPFKKGMLGRMKRKK